MNRTRRTSIALFVTAASAAALVLPGCFGSEGADDVPQGTPATIVDQALRRSIEADSLAANMTATVTGFGMPQEVSVETAIDRPAQRARFSVTAQDQTIELLAIGDDAYVTGTNPELTDALDGRTWLTDLPDDVFGGWHEADYDPMTDLLLKLTGRGRVERTGTDEVAGAQVTTYRFSVQDGVPEGVPDERRDTVRKLVHATGTGKITIEAEVGIDDEGHVRSVDLDAEVRRGSSSSIEDDTSGSEVFADLGTIELGWEAEITTIGEPVDIEAPNASDTVDLADVADGESLLRSLRVSDDD